MPETAAFPSFWKSHLLKADETLVLGCGPLTIYVEKREADWLFASHTHEAHDFEIEAEARGSARPEKDSREWTRWPMPADQQELHLRPLMQDRPILVRPETPIGLARGSEVRFYVAVPVNVSIEIGSGRAPVQLTSFPTVRLSDTWFGNTVEGEYCYAHHTPLRRDLENVEQSVHLAVCPVTITNESREPLKIERFCLRVPQLALYESQGRLWASTVNVVNRTKDEQAEISFERRAPKEVPDARMVSEAAKKETGHLITRTFNILHK